MKSDSGFTTAVEISNLKEDSQIRPGDYIRSVNGNEITCQHDLIRLLKRSLFGRTVELKVER